MTAEVNYEEYDPFSILELESDATMSEIRKQYRKLSKVYHPDKEGGDQQMFMKIAKAYEALVKLQVSVRAVAMAIPQADR